METYADFRREAEKIADAHGFDHSLLPKDSYVEDGHWVSVEGMRCLYFYGERGEETVTYCDNSESLLYQTFKDLTYDKALDYARLNHIKGEDRRRVYFPTHVGLMKALKDEWGTRLEAEYDEILSEHPFDDIIIKRADRRDELRLQGMSREEFVAQAEREFPYPDPE